MPTANEVVKRLRASVVAEHVRAGGRNRVVCYTCGNAAARLKDQGLDVLAVGPGQDLEARGWHEFTKITAMFGGAFDATSGHLPWPLMVTIAERLRADYPAPPWPLAVATGSGETYVVLRLAYPHIAWQPVYGTTGATEFHPAAPLNQLVRLLTP